ncbi:peptidase S53 [Trinickia terrae]|uniref:Peptidase S53 n=1 Tax=Trinickia terrae TaxID=2571161 RepID=A0A4U1IFI5_9BURK|nr:S53 family peptidase [Trinickia terrae]TKC92504.1 peptidase S53 [Trinickia terrae]
MLPLALASTAYAAAPAQTAWVSTETKAFIAPTRTLTATPLAELAAGTPTHVVVSLKLRNASQLQQLARDVDDRRSARYRKFLTHQQFLANYAPTEAQAQAVAAHLRKHGFINIRVAPNRLLVSADGTASSVKSGFNTPLVHFQRNNRDVYANTAPAEVPAELGDVVLSVLGLQDVTRAHPMLHAGPRTQARTLATGTAKGHSPTEFPALYDVGNTPSAANTTVGIITQGGVSQATQDLNQFTSANNLPAVNVQAIQTGSPSGDYSDDQQGQGEWDLDSQSIVGAAGGAVNQLRFYMADNSASGNTGLTQAFNQAVSDNLAKVINVSLGWCEADAYSDGTMAAEDQIFTTAVAQGQTFSVSSGDEGVYECNNRGYPDGGTYSISWPASSPNVIAVGGTTLYTTASDGYASETVWNEGLDQAGKLWASTGGFSSYEASPSWQAALSVSPAPAGRAVPDISFDAAQSTGALVYNYGQLQQIGGTSLASPIFVGFYARLQSANSNALGFPAASIYGAVPSTPSLVHDVTSGNNGYGGYGYNAGKGWDYPTGWGSVDIAKLGAYVQSHKFAQ